MKVSAARSESEMRAEVERAVREVVEFTFGHGLRDRDGNVRTVQVTGCREDGDRDVIIHATQDGQRRHYCVGTVGKLFGMR